MLTHKKSHTDIGVLGRMILNKSGITRLPSSIEELINEVIDGLGIIEMENTDRKIIYDMVSVSKYGANFSIRTHDINIEPVTGQKHISTKYLVIYVYHTDDTGVCYEGFESPISTINWYTITLADDDKLVFERETQGGATSTVIFKVKIKDQ